MFEKKAEEYAKQSRFTEMPNPSLSEDIDISEEIKEAVLYGYNKANGWHDLEEDPTDLPKDCKTLCICLSDYGSKYEPVPQVWVGYYDSLGWADYMGNSLYSNVRFWCESPIQVK